jgi:N-formylglutamate deformylase
MMPVFDFIKGTTPLLISMPHCGTALPAEIAVGMTTAAQQVADTDWHLQRLYDFASGLGASIIQPHTSRYVIDLNRPPDNAELYPGANGTGLCPTSSFAEEPLYWDGAEPDSAEVASRLETYWHPYHQKLQAELARLKSVHGIAVLFEAHSIRSVVPRLFEGQLPDVNIGTAGGSSCAPAILAAVETLLAGQKAYTYVINQRFKGGYITRAYGDPQANVHSLQLELSQRTYMEEQAPFHYRPDLAAQLQPLLRQLVESLVYRAQQETRQP